MSENEWFIDWFSSPYYEQLYFRRNEKEAFVFIQALIGYLNPRPNSRMLDVGCGTGRHSKLLAENGFDVTGIDLSLPSIEAAKKSEKENLHFYRHDMRLPFYVNYFNYAFNFFTSFGYFKSQREHDNAIKSMVSSLLPDGILVIDYLNVHYAALHLREYESLQIEGIDYDIHRWQSESYFFKTIDINDQGSKFSFTEKVRKFTLDDFREMLQKNGMEIKAVFGNYKLQPFDVQQSNRLIIIAEKIS